MEAQKDLVDIVVPLTRHATTNIEVIRQFLGRSIDVAPVGDRVVEVTVGAG
jgi:hypothetical protein